MKNLKYFVAEIKVLSFFFFICVNVGYILPPLKSLFGSRTNKYGIFRAHQMYHFSSIIVFSNLEIEVFMEPIDQNTFAS